ncbi:plasmid partitioning protein RepB C-terminal domain-containing protein, partial [Sphingomonas sp. TZW2008]|uniref:ParB/RepB/Spo0J family partition protein n=1 Tax=Sphingomonas sp. TZW2008 TaxID=1917973 RepID=UPI000A26AE18
MSPAPSGIAVKLGFEEASLRIPIANILPLRAVTAAVKKSVKYNQIAASIAEVGIIEPPVVARDATDPARYHLLDGHLRVKIVQDRGVTEIVCLVATDDEAFTYNRRVSRIAIIQEHKMILNAVKKGVSEERLARALNVDIASIRKKRNLLVGICPEAVELLKDRHVPIHVFTELRFLKAVRQVAAVENMITMNRFTVSYARSLVASTPDDQLVAGKPRRVAGLTDDQVATMQLGSGLIGHSQKMTVAARAMA